VIGILGAGLYFTAGIAPAQTDPPAPPYVKAADIIRYGNPQQLAMQSDVVLIMDDREGVMLYGRRVDRPRPIASLTKLMTALVILEARLPLNEPIEITRADRDRLRGTGSLLPYGAVYTGYDLLHAALGASDNRAASAIARKFPGGTEALVAAMNEKARAFGMTQTRFADSSGLSSANVASARDLVKLAAAVREQPLIQTITTTGTFSITNTKNGHVTIFHNTNRLVRGGRWDIGLSKTGYTADAGNCLLMQTTIANRPVTIVLLDSWGRLSKYGDAERIRDWLIRAERRVPGLTAASAAQN